MHLRIQVQAASSLSSLSAQILSQLPGIIGRAAEMPWGTVKDQTEPFVERVPPCKVEPYGIVIRLWSPEVYPDWCTPDVLQAMSQELLASIGAKAQAGADPVFRLYRHKQRGSATWGMISLTPVVPDGDFCP